jgi:hypothetical protein
MVDTLSVELSFSVRVSVRVARIGWGSLLATQGTYCAKPRGTLDQVYGTRDGQVGGWSVCMEAKLKGYSTFSDDVQMRVGKQLLAVKKPNWERGRVAA